MMTCRSAMRLRRESSVAQAPRNGSRKIPRPRHSRTRLTALRQFILGWWASPVLFARAAQPPVPRWKLFLQATRPFAFTATLFPVLLGTLLAPHPSLPLSALALLGALFAHAGINVLSDYFDFVRGADTWKVLGSSRVLVDGLMSPEVERRLGWSLVAGAAACGGVLAAEWGAIDVGGRTHRGVAHAFGEGGEARALFE